MKLIFDTNVYFALIADPAFLPRHGTWLRGVASRTFLSSVVAAELVQGAKGDLARRRVRRATAALERTGRVLAPTHDDWVRAGTVQGLIWDQHPALRTKPMLADALIACSAARVGALVVTSNLRDFERIGAHVPHRAMSFEDASRVVT